MSKYKVEITGLNTNNIEVLSNEEMLKLFKEYQSGNLFARDLLVEGNLKLVLSILKRFTNRNIDNMDDLFQVGCIGLIKAIDNFDLTHEVRFSTYAVPMILGEVRRYIRDNNPIRISRSIKDIAYKTLNLKEEYIATYAKEPSLSYLAKNLQVPEQDIVIALESLKEPVSLSEPIYNDGGDTIYLFDQIEDKHLSTADFPNQLAITDAINSLVDREKKILDDRYVVGKTQMEVAKELDISQAQVSRLEKKAIKELKKVLK